MLKIPSRGDVYIDRIKRGALYFFFIVIGVPLLCFSFVWYASSRTELMNLTGKSMYPTFIHGEQVLLNRSKKQLSHLKHGQFVVVQKVENREDSKMLKRIIGLPGDHLVVRAGEIIRNGKKVDEPYLNNPNWSIQTPFEGTLGEHEIYVMGDNRNESMDSRTLGPINLNTQYVGIFMKKTIAIDPEEFVIAH